MQRKNITCFILQLCTWTVVFRCCAGFW